MAYAGTVAQKYIRPATIIRTFCIPDVHEIGLTERPHSPVTKMQDGLP